MATDSSSYACSKYDAGTPESSFAGALRRPILLPGAQQVALGLSLQMAKICGVRRRPQR